MKLFCMIIFPFLKCKFLWPRGKLQAQSIESLNTECFMSLTKMGTATITRDKYNYIIVAQWYLRAFGWFRRKRDKYYLSIDGWIASTILLFDKHHDDDIHVVGVYIILLLLSWIYFLCELDSYCLGFYLICRQEYIFVEIEYSEIFRIVFSFCYFPSPPVMAIFFISMSLFDVEQANHYDYERQKLQGHLGRTFHIVVTHMFITRGSWHRSVKALEPRWLWYHGIDHLGN
jgi:hypothetical protein